jgi:TPR repeat protein
MQRHLSAKRRQLILGLILGACISGSVAVATIKYSNSHRESRGSEKAPAELATPKSPVATLPPAAASPSTPSTVSPDIFGGGGSQNKAVGKGHAPSSSVPAAAPGAPARAPLQPSSSGTPSRQKSAMTPQQLWVSVQSGNTKSAVALAELYIKGEGVPQNCNQARVLLLVASEKRDAEAIKRLAELDKTGCPAS